jgi:ferredoxin--NADP+ reductase
MMNEIVFKEELAPEIKRVKIMNPLIAKKSKSGQFVILRVERDGERIPLTLIDWDPKDGTITLVFKEVGASTRKLGRLEVGDIIYDLVGPLGNPGEIAYYGRVCIVGGGVAIASAYERARRLKDAGNSIVAVIGAKTAKSLIYREEFRRLSDELYITTEDGSEGVEGYVSDVFTELLNSGRRFNLVYAVGPVGMMKAVSEATKPYDIRTIVSLNSLMVDGTGMCGCCRVTVGGRTMFTCVDGPEFNAHLVDFEELEAKLGMYSEEEARILKFMGS